MKKSMRRKCFLCSVLFAGALALIGCGEEPYELEDNEREIIANYAAHIISKHNRQQPEGYQYVYVSGEEEDEPEEKPSDDKEKEEEPAAADSGQEEPADGADDKTDDAQEPQEPSVTLSEALGLSGVQAVYTGVELTDRYDAAVPDDGKRLMVLHVTLNNESDKDVDIDMVSVLPIFRATVNNTEETTAELAIFPDNLSTWEGTVGAGKSVETVILFQLSDAEITSVEQLEMQVTAGENVSRVVFL